MLDTPDNYVAGGPWWRENMFDKIGFNDWLESVGGRIVPSPIIKHRLVVEFENDEDALAFKLKYM